MPGSEPDPDPVRDDRELLTAHLAGDRTAFDELVVRHRDRLWGLALRTLGNPEDASDAVQNALISAYRGASSYRGDAAVTTWLHRIVVNACLDLLRRKKVRPTEPLPEEESRQPAVKTDAIAERDLTLVVEAALRTLSIEQRAAIVLVDLQGYSVEDAAAVLDCAPGTVKSRCSRGRARLLPLLEHLRNPDAATRVVSSVDPTNNQSTDQPTDQPTDPQGGERP